MVKIFIVTKRMQKLQINCFMNTRIGTKKNLRRRKVNFWFRFRFWILRTFLWTRRTGKERSKHPKNFGALFLFFVWAFWAIFSCDRLLGGRCIRLRLNPWTKLMPLQALHGKKRNRENQRGVDRFLRRAKSCRHVVIRSIGSSKTHSEARES